MGRAFALISGLAAMGCALSAPPRLHYPNHSRKLGGSFGYHLPFQPARARVLASDGSLHEVRANTALLEPEIPVFQVGYLVDPKVFGSYGLGEHATLVADLSWHRIGVSTHFFAGSNRTPVLKLAAGASAGIFVREGWGWLEIAALPAFGDAWIAELGLGVAAGRFRHLLTLPDLESSDDDDEGTLPSVGDLLDLYRDEVRLRLPLGASIRFGKASAVFAVVPGMTLLHGDPGFFNCRAADCSDLQDFSQRFAIEVQAGVRF